MNNVEPIRVAFEGERGSGKTTVVLMLAQNLEERGFKVAINRKISTGKFTHPTYTDSLKFHQKWEQLIKGDNNPQKAEAAAFTKFHLALTWFLEEEEIFGSVKQKNDVLICDRDIDSIVLYAAVEIILANSDKYSENVIRTNLIRSLWSMVTSVRGFPDITYCLTSTTPEQTLNRSYQSRKQTEAEYELNQIQIDSQNLACNLLDAVINERPSRDKKLFVVNIDGKNPNEIVRTVLTTLNV